MRNLVLNPLCGDFAVLPIRAFLTMVLVIGTFHTAWGRPLQKTVSCRLACDPCSPISPISCLGSALQANFIVPASREAVDSNSAWNEELRGHLPDLFCKALDSFKALPGQDSLLWVNRWLQCIPLQGEVRSFCARLPHVSVSIPPALHKQCLCASPLCSKSPLL